MKAMSRFVPLAVFVLVLALPSQAQQGQIRGELYGVDGEPVPGATILLDQLVDGSRHYELESDSRGLFVHLSVSLARYQLTLVLDGRPAAIVEVQVGAGENPLRLDLARQELESYEFSRLLGTTERVVRELTMVGENEVVAVPGGPGGPNPFDNSAEREAAAEASAAMREAFEAGRAAMDAQDYEEAIRQFTLAADEAPTPQHVIHANLGQAYERARRYEEAIESFEEAQATATAQEIPPETTNYYTNLTLVYAMAGQVEKALENAEKAAAASPGAAGMSFYNIGVVLTNAGQTASAVEAFRRATEVNPDLAEAHYETAIAYVSLDSLEEAVPFLERYLELEPEGGNAETARQLLQFVAESQ